uniref:Uncharacterized protein n=1 Tax=Laticauda laticaudata TaxID=8630 RepID=A0A8C5SJ30_LATLA
LLLLLTAKAASFCAVLVYAILCSNKKSSHKIWEQWWFFYPVSVTVSSYYTPCLHVYLRQNVHFKIFVLRCLCCSKVRCNLCYKTLPLSSD